jgi:hypothetical protein
VTRAGPRRTGAAGRAIAGYNATMRPASETLDQTFLEMRWRCLSLAADLDRIERAPGGAEVFQDDARLAQLRRALAVLIDPAPGRAERVQMTFSDVTPGPE